MQNTVTTQPRCELQLKDHQLMAHNLPVEVYAIERGVKEGRVTKGTAERALGHTLSTEALAYCLAFYRNDECFAVETRFVDETYRRMEEHLGSSQELRKIIAIRHPDVNIEQLVYALWGGEYSKQEVVLALSDPSYRSSIAHWAAALTVPLKR